MDCKLFNFLYLHLLCQFSCKIPRLVRVVPRNVLPEHGLEEEAPDAMYLAGRGHVHEGDVHATEGHVQDSQTPGANG
jgi:hypothetical protein